MFASTSRQPELTNLGRRCYIGRAPSGARPLISFRLSHFDHWSFTILRPPLIFSKFLFSCHPLVLLPAHPEVLPQALLLPPLLTVLVLSMIRST